MSTESGSGGLVPAPVELGGLTEIRVHGVGGTSPESLLGDSTPTRVAGDRVAGFYRTSDAAGRHREAYSWGGLTSRSRMRALWALLLPSMLANMAGWMARRWVTAGEEEVIRPATRWEFRWFARLSALALTLSTAAMVTYLALDVLAYQWGRTDPLPSPDRAAQPDGVPGGVTSWWNQTVETWTAVDRPGNRIVLGAVAAVLVALVFAVLARHSRSSYESVVPPTPISAEPGAPDVTTTAPPPPNLRCAAALDGGLRAPDFWAGLEWHRFLSRIHLTACLAVVALMLGWSTWALGAGTDAAYFGLVATVASAAALLLVMGLLTFDDAQPDLGWIALTLTTAALVLAGTAAVLLPSDAGPAGMLPGARPALNVVWGVSLVLLVPLAVQQSFAWLYRLRQSRKLRAQHRPVPRLSVFPWAGPFVMNTIAMVVANTVLLSAIVYVAGVLGTVAWGFGPAEGTSAAPGTIYVPMAIGSLASILSLGLILLVVLFGLTFVVVLRRRTRLNAPTVEADLRTKYAEAGIPDVEASAPAGTEAAWWRSAFDPPLFGVRGRQRRGRPTPWVHKVTTMRFVGDHSRAVAVLFIALTVSAVLGLVLFLNQVLLQHREPPMFFVGIGTKVAVAFPPLYVLVLTLAWRNERWRRVLGSLFDVGTFFPRAFHPFAPPAYAERAVPELTRRIWRLHDNGGRVVVSAHSQGSVIAAAALGRTSGRAGQEPTIGVVTFGSPLGKLYRWAFPALFSDGFLAGIPDDRAGIGPVLWRNVSYATDYIGGRVSTGSSTITDSVDVTLVDPPTHRYVVDQPLPRVLSHTGYWYDESFWREVDEMCSLTLSTGGPRPGADSGGGGVDLVPPDPTLSVNYRAVRL
ncbi:hypothetical protein [Cellulomonas sp. Leaf395]|uniref:hypothetical protein n=1 Tax=Cellulomonas sp. Leaf395 TaxID=1736362 RepID=UPI000B058E45|nr:hypothetical protein [Cellulomonas sp. Leaf395]